MNSPERKICIVLNKPLAYSETFIKAHVDGLNAQILYTSSFPRANAVEKGGGVAYRLKRTYWSFLNRARSVQASNFLKRNGTELLMAEYGMTAADILPFCKQRKIPLAVHFHGYDAYRTDILEKYKSRYQHLFAYASAIVVVSRDMEQQVIKLGAPAGKVHYNVYGVDANKFPQADIESSKKQLLAVGRFVEKKAPYLTILAFKKVVAAIPDATLVMVGDGPLWHVCKQMVSSLGLSQHVFFRGALAHHEVSALMQQSRAFVQHSVIAASGDSEGTPNTILEAQASGLPVISTRHAGIKDVVLEGKTGCLVEEGDIHRMAEHMIRLLDDAVFAATMGGAGRENMLGNYSMEQSLSCLTAILNNCKPY